jgi:hypothetical protein
MRTSSSTYGALALLLAAGFVLWAGCDGGGTAPNLTANYTIDGALVIDPNLDSLGTGARVAVHLRRENSIFQSGDISFGQRQLSFRPAYYGLDSVYTATSDATMEYPNTTQTLDINDTTKDVAAIAIPVADTLSILEIVPFNRLVQGNDQVSVDWDGANLAQRYFLATVLADSAYTGYGTSYLTSLATQGTIPPDAFLIPGTDNPDTGLYNIYVYAVTGNPDSAVASALLPVPLPEQLGNNIDTPDIMGRFGTVVVSLYDTVRVVQVTQ